MSTLVAMIAGNRQLINLDPSHKLTCQALLLPRRSSFVRRAIPHNILQVDVGNQPHNDLPPAPLVIRARFLIADSLDDVVRADGYNELPRFAW